MRSISSKTLALALFMLVMFASDVMMVKAGKCTVLPIQSGSIPGLGGILGGIPGLSGFGSTPVDIPGASSCTKDDDCKSPCSDFLKTAPLPIDCGKAKCQ